MNRPRRNLVAALLVAAALVALVMAIYHPVLGYGFLGYDLDDQLVENPVVRSLAPANLVRIFTTRNITSYYPFRTLSYAVDHALWGLDPAGFHLTNLLLHGGNVLLVFALLLRLLPPPAIPADARPGGLWRVAAAGAGAALVAVHPLAVEPVAWIGAREELIATLGILLALHAFMTFRCRTGGKAAWAYAGAVGAGAVACGGNVVGAIVPVVVTAWDALRAGRPGLRKTFLATAPLWALGLAAIVLKLAEPHDSDVTVEPIGLAARVRLVPWLYAMNWRAFLWPTRLAIRYPPIVPESVLAPGVLAGLGAIAATVGAGVALAVRRRWTALAAVVWFVAALAPSAQILPHHLHRADRFLYLPLAALVVMLASLAAGLCCRCLRGAAVVLALALVAVLVPVTAARLKVWSDPVRPYVAVVEMWPGSVLAWHQLGVALEDQGRLDAAIAAYRRGIALQPDFSRGLHVTLGDALMKRGDADAATEQFRAGLFSPQEEVGGDRATTVYPRRRLADALLQARRLDEAARQYARVVELRPSDYDARYNLGLLRVREGRPAQALPHFRAAIEARPEDVSARLNLANTLVLLDRLEEAEAELRRAVEVAPWHFAVHHNLGRALGRQGRWVEAASALEAAAASAPGRLDVLLALADAWARAGDFDRAVAVASDAESRARAAGAAAVLDEVRARLRRYRDGEP